MEQSEMKVEAHITRTDLLRMQFYMLFRLPANLYFFAFFWLAMAVVALFAIDDFSIPVYLLVVTFFTICGFVGATTVVILMQLVSASEKQGFIGPQAFEIRDDAFVEISSGTTTTTDWASISRIYTSRNYLYVLISALRVHIVPRRAFDSKEQFQAFASEVRSRASAG